MIVAGPGFAQIAERIVRDLGVQAAGIGGGGLRPHRAGLHDGDGHPGARQFQRSGAAGDPAADDNHIRLQNDSPKRELPHLLRPMWALC